MAGFTTHYLFGQQTYDNLRPSDLKYTIQRFHRVFSLGLQGPDIFFYLLPSHLPYRTKVGSIMHTSDTNLFFRNLIESVSLFSEKYDRQVAKTYIYGFLGHYLLDSACHPYIYARTNTEKKTASLGKHICLETDIDICLLRHFLHKTPDEFHQKESIALTKEQMNIIADLLFNAFAKTYPEKKLTKKQIISSVHGMQKWTRFANDSSGYKKLLFRRIEQVFFGYPILSALIPNEKLIFHKDPCNETHRHWRNPWNRSVVSSESFYDLFHHAQKEYTQLLNDIAFFFQTKRSPAEQKIALELLLNRLGNNCYHSGLPIETE